MVADASSENVSDTTTIFRVPACVPQGSVTPLLIPIVHVAHDGDLILNPLQTKEMGIRVSLETLANASPVFREMFSRRFKGAQDQPSASSPPTVELPDDDSDTMHLMCTILHHNWDAKCLPSGQLETIARMRDLALMADKYQPVNSLNTKIPTEMFESWMEKDTAAVILVEHMADLALAAYIFQRETLFSLWTRRMIMDFNTPMSQLRLTPFFQYVPSIAILVLEEQRSFVRLSIDDAVRQFSNRRCSQCRTRRYDPEICVEIAKKLDPPSTGWPPNYGKKHTIRSTIRAIDCMQHYHAFEEDEHDLCADHRNWSVSEPRHFQMLAKKLNAQAQGLCYSCTRKGKHPTECEHADGLRVLLSTSDPVWDTDENVDERND